MANLEAIFWYFFINYKFNLTTVYHIPKCNLLAKTMFISVHCGGKFLTNEYEIYYSKEAINSLMVDDDTSIWDLKSMIYECTGYDPERYNLELATRLNSGIS